MPTRELAPIQETESGLARRLAPSVVSTANPPPVWLLRARTVIREEQEIQEFFRRAREENRTTDWLTSNLAVRFSGIWGAEKFEEAHQVARYLADEFAQLGEGIQVISTETGKVEAILDEGDLYFPQPLPREDGSIARTPLPRMNPKLEANLITWTVERKREEQILQALAARAVQTDLQREEGDPRLLAATRKGRSTIVRDLTAESPKDLLESCGGTTAAFLQHFKIKEGPFDESSDYEIATARSRMGIQDPTTLNLGYDRRASLRQIIPQGWVRNIVLQIAEEARKQKRVEVIPLDELDASDLGNYLCWVAPPEAIPVIRKMLPKVKVLPVNGSCLVGFPEMVVGELTISDTFFSESHEIWDRWEVVGNLPYRMKVDLCQVRTLIISGIGAEGHLVRPS